VGVRQVSRRSCRRGGGEAGSCNPREHGIRSLSFPPDRPAHQPHPVAVAVWEVVGVELPDGRVAGVQRGAGAAASPAATSSPHPAEAAGEAAAAASHPAKAPHPAGEAAAAKPAAPRPGARFELKLHAVALAAAAAHAAAAAPEKHVEHLKGVAAAAGAKVEPAAGAAAAAAAGAPRLQSILAELGWSGIGLDWVGLD
jgi:hypothetical protein